MGVGFPHRARGGTDPRDYILCPRVVGVADVWKLFIIREWNPILPGRGGISVMSRGETLDARWLYEPQSNSDQPVGVEFPHHAGQDQPGGSPLSFPG